MARPPVQCRLAVAALAGLAGLVACSGAGHAPTSAIGHGPTSGASATSHAPSAAPTTATLAPAAPADLRATGLLAGTAAPHLPAGDPDQISVIVFGAVVESPSGATVPVIVRNNTPRTVGEPQVSAVARDASGTVTRAGDSHGFHPTFMKPGQAALGVVTFPAGTTLPAHPTFHFTVQARDPSAPFRPTDLTVGAVTIVRGIVVGTASNATGHTMAGPYSVEVFCFDRTGALLGATGTSATPGHPAPPGTAVSFEAKLSGQECPTYIVGASAQEGS